MKKIIVLLAFLSCLHFATAEDYSEKTRADFQRAYAKALAGDTSVLNNYRHLQEYPLWPDLQAAAYRHQFGKTSDPTILEFIERYSDFSSVGQLRNRWIKSLAKRQQWATLHQALTQFYPNTEDTVLLCLDARAQQHISPGNKANAAALEIWMSAESLPDECDVVFKTIQDARLLTRKRLRQRMDLALEAGNTSLATYLAKSAGKKEQSTAQAWAAMRRNALGQLKAEKRLRDNADNRALLFYGLKRAARKDPIATRDLWASLSKRHRFSQEEQFVIERSIALSAARDQIDEALPWLQALVEHDAESSVWFVRRAMAAQDWPLVYAATFTLTDEDQKDETWLYWRARALEAMGQRDDAHAIYAEVAKTRSYYGFLAADRIEAPYSFNHESIAPDETVLTQLSHDIRLIRAYELYRVNLHGFGRSEWDRATNAMDQAQKQQAALLAHRWNWHSRAIATHARTAANDLVISHPTPYQQQFDSATYQSGIDTTWAYGIARSESLFMPDVRSRANAYGLMQLLPSTGKVTAKAAHVPYRGRSTLLDPDSNIRLGTHYLGQIYAQLSHNQVLATAAYNAGPHRVKSWLPEQNDWHADIWVENIPFTETRRYVKRVLAAQAITHWRLTGKQQRLASVMPPVESRLNKQNRLAKK